MMVMQHAPFMRADPDDEYYSYIIMGDYDEFWRIHQNYDGESINVTLEFKDLFNNMVTVDPDKRLKLKHGKSSKSDLSCGYVTDHEWVNGYTPLHQEIYENFSYRKMVLDKANDKQAKISEAKAEDSKDERTEKKYTKYFKTQNGEKLVEVVISFAIRYEIRYKN